MYTERSVSTKKQWGNYFHNAGCAFQLLAVGYHLIVMTFKNSSLAPHLDSYMWPFTMGLCLAIKILPGRLVT